MLSTVSFTILMTKRLRHFHLYNLLLILSHRLFYVLLASTASLEEARANGEASTTIDHQWSSRWSYGPPMVLVTPLLLVLYSNSSWIALGLSKGGSVLGPLFYVVVWNLTCTSAWSLLTTRAIAWALLLLRHLLVLSPRLSVAPLLSDYYTMVIGSVAATWD